VTAEFDALLAPRRRRVAPDALTAYWRALPESGEAEALADAGFVEAGNADAMLRDLARSPACATCPTWRAADRVLHAAAGRRRLDAADAALRRLPAAQRAASQCPPALLDEQPAALARLVEVVSRSALLAERLAAYPLLLDELLDARVAGHCRIASTCTRPASPPPPAAMAMSRQCCRPSTRCGGIGFRIAMAVREAASLPPTAPASWRGWPTPWSRGCWHWRAVRSSRRTVAYPVRASPCRYGSLGGEELGFGSDLDLVFLHDMDRDTDGERQRR
jgi:glutamate-ammonia-ligase adenylyltransferase